MALFLKILLVISSLGLITSIVLQSGKSYGLAGSIAGGAEQLFGKKKAKGLDDLFSKLTLIAAVIFFVLSLVLAYFIG